MADMLQTQAISNLIQGVSQQVPQQRRDTQCEEQFDCFNSPVEGCVARTSAELVAFLAGLDLTDAYAFEIERSDDERYIAVVLDGDLKVFDLLDGTECAVTFPDGKAYLGITGIPKDTFVSTIIDDYSFIANREIIPAMASTLSPARPKEALIHFRAGAYSMKFQLAITYAGNIYTWTYKTPDNSVASNADYIATNQLAATFYRALTGADATPPATGSVASSSFANVGSSSASSGTVTGDITATSLGFQVAITGSCLRLWRTDGVDFTIDTADGAGDTYFIAIKDAAKAFSMLPASAFEDFTVKIKGVDGSKDDDYWVVYRPGGGGYWEETLAPGIKTSLDGATMPWTLVNTAYRTFVFKKAPWGARVAGDEDSSPEPSFIGARIEDLFSDHSRLGIVIEAGAVWSKSRNPYVFFPDSAMTILGTAPIDYTVMGGKQISVFRRAVQADESVFLWAQRSQFRVTSGADPFKQDTIEAKKSAAYLFANKCPPLHIGQSLYFAAEPGNYAVVRELLLADGKIRGDSNITRHVPRYVPADLRYLVGADTLEMLIAFSERTPSRLYAYNWVIDGQQRAQSAWNTLRLPEGCVILWAGIYNAELRLLVQRDDGCMILRMDLSESPLDPDGDYHTRADLRVSEEDLVVTYDAVANTSTIVAPFEWVEAEGDPTKAIVAVRLDNPTGYARGYVFEVVEVSGSTIVVKEDARGHALYAGLRITSERTESQFFVRTETGASPAERVHVADVVYSHAKTAYYRAEVTLEAGRAFTYEFTGKRLGSQNNRLDAVVTDTGTLRVPLQSPAGTYKLRLVNDTHLPSAWQSAWVHYQATDRALPPTRRGA